MFQGLTIIAFNDGKINRGMIKLMFVVGILAPAAYMTWDLAESSEPFITSVINGSDLVPTFSATSVDDLRAEVTTSTWVNDFREQIERTRFLSIVYRSTTALGSWLPLIAKASRARVARASAIWCPISNNTQVVMRQAQTMA